MHRAILIAWLPWFLLLLVATATAWLVLRFSGAKLSPAKLRHIHRCEAGSVQTLSFVLTLPVFIMLLMFIVQVADLMMGIGIVHYAAFAAARAASVWIPAEMPGEPANTFVAGSLKYRDLCAPEWLSDERDSPMAQGLWKYGKILNAAAIACTPISPARDMKYLDNPPSITTISAPIKAMYPTLSPTLSNYPRIQQLIDKKLSYTARGANTRIVFSGIDRDCAQGPTYNPCPEHLVTDPSTGNLIPIPWNPLEVGWEDPITVTVFHSFALMPGPGRLLATVLSPPDGTPDTVSGLVIRSTNANYQGDNGPLRLYHVVLSASVTLSNEGLKSVMPYVQYQSAN